MTDDLFGECGAGAAGSGGRAFVCREPFGHPPPHVWSPDDPGPAPAAAEDPAGPEAFVRFHDAHPEVYDGLVRLARRLDDAGGGRHLSFRMLWETLRYESAVGAGRDEGPYRLNNNHIAYYSRLLMEREPFLAGRFEVRALRPGDAYPPSP